MIITQDTTILNKEEPFEVRTYMERLSPRLNAGVFHTVVLFSDPPDCPGLRYTLLNIRILIHELFFLFRTKR